MHICASQFSKFPGGACPRTPLEGARASPRRDRYAITSFGVLEFHAPPWLKSWIRHCFPKYVRFVWQDRLYEFQRMCLGLSSAPYISRKWSWWSRYFLDFGGKAFAAHSILITQYMPTSVLNCWSHKQFEPKPEKVGMHFQWSEVIRKTIEGHEWLWAYLRRWLRSI